jgi:hypothetical protein
MPSAEAPARIATWLYDGRNEWLGIATQNVSCAVERAKSSS